VEENATSKQIKSAYRRLQKKCHPDIAGDEGHDMSMLLNKVYKTLMDENLRAVYDEAAGYVEQLQHSPAITFVYNHSVLVIIPEVKQGSRVRVIAQRDFSKLELGRRGRCFARLHGEAEVRLEWREQERRPVRERECLHRLSSMRPTGS